jgi:hypothetical protein
MQKLIFGAPRTGNHELTVQIQRLSIYMQNKSEIKLIFKSAPWMVKPHAESQTAISLSRLC